MRYRISVDTDVILTTANRWAVRDCYDAEARRGNKPVIERLRSPGGEWQAIELADLNDRALTGEEQDYLVWYWEEGASGDEEIEKELSFERATGQKVPERFRTVPL